MMPSAFRSGRPLGTTVQWAGGARALVLFLSAGMSADAVLNQNIETSMAVRPVRIEDADASARHSLDFQIAPLRFDRITGGVYRWQLERFSCDVVSDILTAHADQAAQRQELLTAVARYRDDTSAVTTRAEWLEMSRTMDVRRMGGSAITR